jgi:hypothetical protein
VPITSAGRVLAAVLSGYTGRRNGIGWYVCGSAELPSPRRSIPPAPTSVVRTPNGNDYGKDLLRQDYAEHDHSHPGSAHCQCRT